MLDKKTHEILNSIYYHMLVLNGYEMGDDKSKYANSINDIIDFLNLNKDTLNLTDSVISDYHICLQNKHSKSYIKDLIRIYYKRGSIGGSDYLDGLYKVFNGIFKYEYMDKSFDDTLHVLSLMRLTDFGAIDNYLDDFILFKRLAYEPNEKNNIRNKVKYISALRNKKSHIREFIKIDRKINQ